MEVFKKFTIFLTTYRISISHVYREANTVVESLANYGCHCQCSNVDFNTVRTFLILFMASFSLTNLP